MFLLLLLVDNIKKNSAFHKVFTPIYVCVCVCVCVRVRAFSALHFSEAAEHQGFQSTGSD